MLKVTELNEVKAIIKDFKPENSYYEDVVLVPHLKSIMKRDLET